MALGFEINSSEPWLDCDESEELGLCPKSDVSESLICTRKIVFEQLWNNMSLDCVRPFHGVRFWILVSASWSFAMGLCFIPCDNCSQSSIHRMKQWIFGE